MLYLAVSPDGQTIVTGAGDETLRFWNVFPGPQGSGAGGGAGGLLGGPGSLSSGGGGGGSSAGGSSGLMRTLIR